MKVCDRVKIAVASLVLASAAVAGAQERQQISYDIPGGDCTALRKAVADAFQKVHHIPTHVYTTSKINGQSFNSEMIYAAGSMYMKASGKWTSAGSIEEVEQSEKGNQHNAKDTCRQLNDEPVNNEVAEVYSLHSETPQGALDLQVWISKANGRLLREDTSSHGALISARYDYSDVKAPL